MKVILYMAITANGMIAKEDDSTYFTSNEDHIGFREACLKSKAIITGRKTWDLIREDADFYFPECSYFILTRRQAHNLPADQKKITFTNLSPKSILKLIKQKGFKEACLIGGAQANAAFVKDGLIDEIFLDVEPFIYGKGIPLFQPLADFETKLELLAVKNLSPQTVQLHYKVKR